MGLSCGYDPHSGIVDICANDMMCEDSICKYWTVKDQGIGMECGVLEWLVDVQCATGMECIAGRCTVTGISYFDECGPFHLCATNLACVGNKCEKLIFHSIKDKIVDFISNTFRQFVLVSSILFQRD